MKMTQGVINNSENEMSQFRKKKKFFHKQGCKSGPMKKSEIIQEVFLKM